MLKKLNCDNIHLIHSTHFHSLLLVQPICLGTAELLYWLGLRILHPGNRGFARRGNQRLARRYRDHTLFCFRRRHTVSILLIFSLFAENKSKEIQEVCGWSFSGCGIKARKLKRGPRYCAPIELGPPSGQQSIFSLVNEVGGGEVISVAIQTWRFSLTGSIS